MSHKTIPAALKKKKFRKNYLQKIICSMWVLKYFFNLAGKKSFILRILGIRNNRTFPYNGRIQKILWEKKLVF
jgi:hypothetical protein